MVKGFFYFSHQRSAVLLTRLPRKSRSTTGFAICLAGSVVVFQSKTQKVMALSSTESEFFAAVLTAKVVLFPRSVLKDLKYRPQAPTIIYEDNKACIKIINAHHSTNRTRHIDGPFLIFKIGNNAKTSFL